MATSTTQAAATAAINSSTGAIKIDSASKHATVIKLEIDDAEVVAWLMDRPEGSRDTEFLRAVRIGVLALKAVNVGATMENVRQEFVSLRKDLQGDLDDLFGDRGRVTQLLQQHFGPDGTLPTAFEEYLGTDGVLSQAFDEALGQDGELENRLKLFLGPKGDLANILDRHIGPEGTMRATLESYLGDEGALADGLDEVFGEKGALREELDRIFGERGDLVYKLLDPMSDKTPLGRFRLSLLETMDLQKPGSPLSAIKRDLDEIKVALRVKTAVESEAERGTKKGTTWQDNVLDAVSNIALGYNDSTEDVGDEGGHSGKTGDQVVVLNTIHTGGVAKRIVFEAKNQKVVMKGQMSIWRELDKARANRDAAFAVAVVNAKHRPAKAEQLQYSQPNNAIIVYASEEDDESIALEAAYTLARTLTLYDGGEPSGEVSPELVAQTVKRVNASLELVRGIKHNLTSVITNIESVKETLDKLRDEVTRALGELRVAANA